MRQGSTGPLDIGGVAETAAEVVPPRSHLPTTAARRQDTDVTRERDGAGHQPPSI